MIQLDTLPSMDTLMDRQRLVGWIVRDAIINSGEAYSSAARRWPISLPTLNRLMNTGNVGIRFYRIAEHNLGLPAGLFEMVIDGDIEGIRRLNIDEPMKSHIITGLGGMVAPDTRPWTGRERRRS